MVFKNRSMRRFCFNSWKGQEVVILHVGTNSLGTNKPAEDIANEINDLAVDLRNGENEVVVSAIIPRGDDLALNEKGKVVSYHTSR